MEVILTLIFTGLLTLLFINIKNKSNFKNIFYIPIMVSLITKYVIGDWDKGYKYSLKDILYWTSIILTSVIIIKIHHFLITK